MALDLTTYNLGKEILEQRQVKENNIQLNVPGKKRNICDGENLFPQKT